MASDEKPLPRPASTPFGRKRQTEEERVPLMADEMAMAAAEGRLDEFLRKSLPESEHARNLAVMMMGMTGMMPPGMTASAGHPDRPEQEETAETTENPAAASEDVVRAAQAADVESLKRLLAEEHRKRTGEESPISSAPRQHETGLPDEEKEVLDILCMIAEEQKLSLDWVILRALKRYIENYRKTGGL